VGLRFLKFFNNKIALRRDHLGAQSGASHVTDTLGDAGFPIHKDVQVVRIEHEKACSRESGNVRGSASPTQRCDLAAKK
jgi:hypothetical protein